MEISFSTQDGIQIVAVSGSLGQAEAAAVRNKVEEKINGGRTKILFDLTGYDLENNTSREHFAIVLSYSITRGALAVCCGAQPAHWPFLLLPGDVQPKIFFSRAEGMDFLRNAAAPLLKPSTNPWDQKDDQPLEKTPEKSEEEIQRGIKNQALEDLLEKYKVFQQIDRDDPFRLEFFAQQYKVDPRGEALAAEKKAAEALVKTQDEINTLEEVCEVLAARVKQATIFRKNPVSANELHLKEGTLDKSIEEAKSQIISNGIALENHQKGTETLQKTFDDLKAKFEKEFKDLQTLTEDLPKTHAEETKKLQDLDTKGEQDFQEKKKNLTSAPT